MMEHGNDRHDVPLFGETHWIPVENRSLGKDVGAETIREELPPNAVITLARVNDSDFYHVFIDGDQLAELLHRDRDFFAAIASHLHMRKTRAELDGGQI